MKLKLTREASKRMAVIANEGGPDEASEIVSADYMLVSEFSVSLLEQTIKAVLVFGGYDSSGKWHADIKQRVAAVNIARQRPEQQAMYDALTRCAKTGNPHCNYDESFMRKLLVDHDLLKLANDVVWGLTDAEIHLDGESVFRCGNYRTAEEIQAAVKAEKP